MKKPLLPCGVHFCPSVLRILWPINDMRIVDIGTVYGVGVPETARRAERIGITDQRKKRREVKYSPVEFRRLWADPSLRLDDIAARLGMVKRCVESRAVAMGLPKRKTGIPKVYAFPADFDDMWKAGVTTREIGAFVGRSHNLPSVEARRRNLKPRSKSCGKKLTMLAYQLAKRAKAERAAMIAADMVDGRAHTGRWAA